MNKMITLSLLLTCLLSCSSFGPKSLGYIKHETIDNVFIKTDDIEGTTTYRHKRYFTNSRYGEGMSSYLYPHPPISIILTKKNKSVYFAADIFLMSSNWVYIDNFIISDKQGTNIELRASNYSSVSRDTYGCTSYGCTIYENYYANLNNHTISKIKNLLLKPIPLYFRFSGKYNIDMEMKQEDRNSILEMVDLYYNIK